MNLAQKVRGFEAIESVLSRYSSDALQKMTPRQLETIVRGVSGAAAVLAEHQRVTGCNIFTNSSAEGIRNAFASQYRHLLRQAGK